MKRENKGITLIALVITVTVLIILASIATYSGVGIIRQSKLNKFTTEMKIMQTEVNDLYQKATSGETVEVNGNNYTGLDIYNIGKDLDSKANSVFTSETSGITDKSGYRLYDQDIIQGLGIEGVEEEYFVNVEKRSIISCNGFEYEGTTYYTLDQLPNGLYNAEYEENTNIPTFDVSMEKLNDGTFRMTISNIQYNGYIDKWQVKYQKEGEDYWSTSEDLSFIVPDIGPYDVKIQNGDVVSNIKSTSKKLVRKWVSKIDGNGEEEFLDVKKTSDGGYIAVGYTTSTNINGLTNKGGEDAIIVKYDANGNEQWKKSVGGSRNDRYSGVIEITNGTYVAVGTIYSTDVVDKNGTNIGHGYDWSYDTGSSMAASEGIIGRYDSSGNEVSLKVTGEATDKYTTEQYFEEGGPSYEGFDTDSVANIVISSIAKTSDGNYILTGQKVVAIPSSFADTDVKRSNLVIKFSKEGNKIATNKLLMKGGLYYSIGMKEDKKGQYFVYGRPCKIFSENLESKKEIDTLICTARQLLVFDNDLCVNLLYSEILENGVFYNIEGYSDSGSKLNWQKKAEDMDGRIIKQISKSSESDFVAICEKDGIYTLAKFSADDGSVLEEYDVPTYENVYAIEGKEEFIFLGTPTDEEGITIEGTSGAVIAKYAIE